MPEEEQRGRERDDLAELARREALLRDEARPEEVQRRHSTGGRTARENVEDLVDPGSFVEYGRFAIAAQRGRRDLEELIARTPADGLIAGTARINSDLFGERAACAVLSYDYTVLAGTQGALGHRKKDRLFELIERMRLPTVFFAEGGGLGKVDPDEVGPLEMQTRNGVVDLAVVDEVEATAVAKRLLAYFQGTTPAGAEPDQTALREMVPERERRAYPVQPIIETLADAGSVTVLRRRR